MFLLIIWIVYCPTIFYCAYVWTFHIIIPGISDMHTTTVMCIVAQCTLTAATLSAYSQNRSTQAHSLGHLRYFITISYKHHMHIFTLLFKI